MPARSRSGALALLLAPALAGCEGEAAGTAPMAAFGLAEVFDPLELERDRFDPSWRPHADRDRTLRERILAPIPAPAPGTVPWEDTPPPSPPEPLPGDRVEVAGRPFPVLRLQVLLDRARFSPGVADGRWGKNTAKALYWFQFEHGLEATGVPDAATLRALLSEAGDRPATARYRVGREEVDGPFGPTPASMYAKARLRCLCYRSPAELLAERFHTTPEVLHELNPGVPLDRIEEGTRLRVPDVRRKIGDDRPDRAARVVISRGGFYTHALDRQGRILHHFPSTLGSRYSPSPRGDLRVTGVTPFPRFHFTPELFYDVPDTLRPAVLPPGPNSPIGLVWIQLSRETYGIHGTAAPATIGYVNSHGCVRLTNWDARTLARLVEAGTPVEFR